MKSQKSVFAKKITKTFLRSAETMRRYIEKTKERSLMETPENPFADNEKNAIIKFKHWLLIENEFPYDAIASKNHLLFTRRVVPFK